MASGHSNKTAPKLTSFRAQNPSARGFSNAPLTSRENQILALIGKGEPSKEIAQALGISVWTVASHRKRICAKLGVHTTAELVALAAGTSGPEAPAAPLVGDKRCRVVIDFRDEHGRLHLAVSGRLRRIPGVATVQIGSKTYYF